MFNHGRLVTACHYVDQKVAPAGAPKFCEESKNFCNRTLNLGPPSKQKDRPKAVFLKLA
jgi:hypothetical protein